MARRATLSGVRRLCADTTTSPRAKSQPRWRQKAPAVRGAASSRGAPGSSSSSVGALEKRTSSMGITESKPAGMAVPVFAQPKSRPSLQREVSGMPSAKSAKRTAMPSIWAQVALGTSVAALQSVAQTRPHASRMPTSSVADVARICVSSASIACSLVSVTCAEWSLMAFLPSCGGWEVWPPFSRPVTGCGQACRQRAARRQVR